MDAAGRLLKQFPKLADHDWSIHSAASPKCNCAGHAIGFEANELWPDEHPDSYTYWPEEIERKETVKCFRKAFQYYGFAECADEAFEEGTVKIAIYEYADGKPSHVAWQHASKQHWHSKIGAGPDIIHSSLDALSGRKPAYGRPALYMQMSVEQYRELWRQFAASRPERSIEGMINCELDLGLRQATNAP